MICQTESFMEKKKKKGGMTGDTMMQAKTNNKKNIPDVVKTFVVLG